MKKILIILLLSVALALNTFGQIVYEKGNITKDTITLKETTITASYKATKFAPFSFKNIDSEILDLRGRELEPAGLLQHTPSMTYNTDNGLFTGYSYYRLRGIDQTRINVTLNGVPMNEPEDQGIYFNNYTNFLQTISEIQIIRGAGISKSGVSSYGGSINFDSYKPLQTQSEIRYTFGSFNTSNLTANWNAEKGWIRVSHIKTDGYKYHSGNESSSMFYGYNLFKNTTFYGFIGKQYNQMAWIGAPMSVIRNDRRFNANKETERDEFLYVHNQLHYNNKSLNAVVYHTYLNGWYNMDLGHFNGIFNQTSYKLSLNSNWFGTNINAKLFDETFLGISAYTYKRNHDNLIAFPNIYETYNENYGTRNEISPYFKTTYKIRNFTLYGDFQYRFTIFDYQDLSEDFNLDQQKWGFFNWSIGSTTNLTDKIHFYWGLGQNHREPTRTDLFGGSDEYNKEIYSNIIPEEVVDFEIGTKFYGENIFFNINGYYMDFVNEIVLNGKIGPNSIVIHSNVTESYRAGIELDFKYELQNWKFINVSSLSHNVIIQDDTRFTHVLSPSFITTSDIIYNLNKFTTGVTLRYNSESYIDLTNENKIPSYSIINFYNSIKFNKFDLGLHLNNIFNKLYYTYGNIGFDGEPGYFQQAGFHFLISLKYKI